MQKTIAKMLQGFLMIVVNLDNLDNLNNLDTQHDMGELNKINESIIITLG
jgi:hypothetical protein